MTTVKLPRGSILQIEAKDLLATPAGTTLIWNKVTEHNRSEFNMSIERIERTVRTSNGTVDGAWGAEDIRTFYLSDAGKAPFNIRINLAKTGSDQSSSGYESATVMFSSCNFTLIKRGTQPFWNVSLTLDEV